MSTQKTRVAGHMAAIFTMLIWGTTIYIYSRNCC